MGKPMQMRSMLESRLLFCGAVLVLGLLLASCQGGAPATPTAAPTTTATAVLTIMPSIMFTNEEVDLEGIQWIEESAIGNGVWLDPWGIYALNKDLVFLFGGLDTFPGTFRSVLLRSNDGGEHWYEVMEPQRGSEVTEMVFVEDGYGWALVMWTVEGPGPARLYHTTDYGESWQELPSIPYPGDHSITCDLQFFDQQRGQVRVDKYAMESYCLLNTTDGGLTWHETGDCCNADECDYQWPGWREKVAMTARDGSQWQLETQGFDVPYEARQIIVSRRLLSDDTWTVVSRLPQHFEYSDGQPVVPDSRIGPSATTEPAD
jgi:hypothetical protein